MSRYTTHALRWVVLCALVPLAASAQTEVERRVAATTNGTVEIENISGSVVVTAWDRDEVEVTGTLGRGVEELQVDSSGSRTEIEVILPRRGWGGGEAHLRVKVPRQSSLEIDLVSAEATVSGVTGDVEVEGVSGSVEVDGQPASVDVETVSGSIDVQGSPRMVSVVTVSGSITIEEASGEIEAEAVSGRVRLAGEEIRRARIQVVSGRVEFTGSLAPRSDFEVESHSGSIDLSLPESTSARFDVTTYSGRIRNDLGPQARKTGRFTPESELRFTLGDGSGQVKLESFSGSVNIRKR